MIGPGSDKNNTSWINPCLEEFYQVTGFLFIPAPGTVPWTVVGCKVGGRRKTSKINEHKSYHIAQEAKRLRLEEALGAPMDNHALPVPHIGNMGDQ